MTKLFRNLDINFFCWKDFRIHQFFNPVFKLNERTHGTERTSGVAAKIPPYCKDPHGNSADRPRPVFERQLCQCAHFGNYRNCLLIRMFFRSGTADENYSSRIGDPMPIPSRREPPQCHNSSTGRGKPRPHTPPFQNTPFQNCTPTSGEPQKWRDSMTD